MNVEKAGLDDIDALVKMRLNYLREDNGSLTDFEISAIRKDLPGYFRVHMDKDLFVYVIRENQAIVACAFLLTIEKPMSPSFINGKTGIVLNVYTCLLLIIAFQDQGAQRGSFFLIIENRFLHGRV